MLPQEIIRKKRQGGCLTQAELEAFFYAFLAGDVADYQVSAMLMAIVLRGMTPDEAAVLTRVMRDSGETLSWPYPPSLLIDKHSTGGIGDKTSLIVLPLCLLEGLRVPMMAGRGLGHTGGTLDKLEAVGWNVFPTPAAARRQVEEVGGIIMGQTDKIAPLDRRLYALRDVTATIESVPLICGSILSKKLASGVGGLVMDVKVGRGAFMQTMSEATELALSLKAVGEGLGLRMRCLLTSMDSPLGGAAGNALEIKECVEVLQGAGPEDTRQLSLELAAEMILLSRPHEHREAVMSRLAEHLASGAAFEKFLAVARAQGGDLNLLENPATLVRAPFRVAVSAPSGGFVESIDVRALGLLVVDLGGGRRLVNDVIDPWVGLTGLRRVGVAVAAGEPLAEVHANSAEEARRAAAAVAAAYRIGPQQVQDALIREVI